jgi:hypothetical protein
MMSRDSLESIEVFYSYAQRDRALRDELEKHLGALKRLDLIRGWHQRDIQIGTDWKQAVDVHLDSAHVILLLISSDFMNSDYCYSVEMQRAFERHKQGKARVIPILLRPVDLEGTLIASLRALPTGGKPITQWSNRDAAFTDVSKGIRQVIQELKAASASPNQDSTSDFAGHRYPQHFETYSSVIPTSNNPFHYDGPLLYDSEVYLKRRHKSAVYLKETQSIEEHALELVKCMKWFTINEPKQCGKTSLISWLRNQKELLDDGYSFASVDMSMLARITNLTEETWYRTLYSDVLHQITVSPNDTRLFRSEAEWPPAPTGSHEWPKSLFQLAEHVFKAKRRLIIVLDRMTRTNLQMIWIGSCFRTLRYILDERLSNQSLYSLAFLFVGTYDIQSLMPYGESDFYDITHVHLPDFTEEDVKKLTTHLHLPTEEIFPLAKHIYYWTEGHPYLTQRLCSHLAESHQSPITNNVVDRIVRLHLRTTQLPLFSKLPKALEDSDLRMWIMRLLRGDKITFLDDIPAHLELKLMGLIKIDDEAKCTIRNRIYKELLEAALDAEDTREFTKGGGREAPGYVDLEIGLFASNTNRYKVELRFTQPSNRTVPEPIQRAVRFNFNALLSATSDPAVYSQLLTKFLFKNQQILALFQKACTIAETLNTDLRLRLFIHSHASKLHDLRWETLLHPIDNSRLLTNERILFSRFLGSHNYRPIQLTSKDNLRALVVIANPTDIRNFVVGGQRLEEVNSEQVLDMIYKNLGNISINPLFSTSESPGQATLENLIEKIRDGFNILYLVCHGAVSTSEGERMPRLWLEKNDGSADVVTAQDLVERLRGLSTLPQLVVLSSCQSAGGDPPHTIGKAEMLIALGPVLVQEVGIPAVIGMHGDILVPTENKFMDVFFRELLRDGRIDRAMTAARSAVINRPDWWIPVLFTHLKDGLLWSTPTS